MVVMMLSPGSGYAHDESTGCVVFVDTMCIMPTPRSSCWNVAIFFESGDHDTTGRSECVQPALSVA